MKFDALHAAIGNYPAIMEWDLLRQFNPYLRLVIEKINVSHRLRHLRVPVLPEIDSDNVSSDSKRLVALLHATQDKDILDDAIKWLEAPELAQEAQMFSGWVTDCVTLRKRKRVI